MNVKNFVTRVFTLLWEDLASEIIKERESKINYDVIGEAFNFFAVQQYIDADLKSWDYNKVEVLQREKYHMRNLTFITVDYTHLLFDIYYNQFERSLKTEVTFEMAQFAKRRMKGTKAICRIYPC